MDKYLLYAIASNACFALIGVAYRLGERRQISPTNIIVILALAGIAYFAPGAFGTPLGDVPARVWVWGVLAGLSQYGCLTLINRAVRMGPLSPLWCAMMCAFIPAVFWAVAFGEQFRASHVVAVLAAVGCVVAASALQHKPADGPAQAAGAPGHKWLYSVLLLGILLANSVCGIAMKDLQMVTVGGRTLMDAHGDFYCMAMYVFLWAPSAAEMAIRRPSISKTSWLLLGCLGAAGSVVGLVLACVSVKGVAAVVFPVGAVTGILVTSGLSVLLFRERVTKGLYVCVALAIIAVLAGSVGSAMGL